MSNWQSYATTTVEIKLLFLDLQRLLLLSVWETRRRCKFALTNTHFCVYGMLSVSTFHCGKHWMCLVVELGRREQLSIQPVREGS